MLKLRYLIILGLLLTITACGGGDRKKMLTRKWKFDVAALKTIMEAEIKKQEKENPAGIELAKKMVEGMLNSMGEMTLEFKSDGTFETTDGKNKIRKQTWKLSDDKSEVITTDEKGKETKLKIKSISSSKVVLEGDEASKKRGGLETLTLIPA
jgi:hypothetical protein